MKNLFLTIALALFLAAPVSAQVVFQPTGGKVFNDFVQLQTVNTAAPSSTDCNDAAETGRLYLDTTNDVMYFCSGASGWVSVSGGATTLTWPVVVPNGGAVQTATGAGNTALFQGYHTGTASYETLAHMTASASQPKWFFDLAPRFSNHVVFGQDGGSTLYSQTANELAYAPLSLAGSALSFKIGTAEKLGIDASGNVLVGTRADTGIPQRLSLGSGFGAGAVNSSANIKLYLYDDGSYFYGLGVSNASLELTGTTDASFSYGTPSYGTLFKIVGEHGRAEIGPIATKDRLILSPVAKGANQFDGTITSQDLTAARTWTLPDATGTVALVPDYGQAYFTDSSATISVAGTYTLIDGFTANTTSGITWDAGNDIATIAKTGIYQVFLQFSFNGGANKAYDCAVFKNDTTELNEVHFSRTMGAASAIGSASAMGIVSLAATDTLRVKCLAGGGDTMALHDGQLTITQVR